MTKLLKYSLTIVFPNEMREFFFWKNNFQKKNMAQYHCKNHIN